MKTYSADGFLIIFRELHRQGYRDLRFYSFLRWVGTLGIFLYREMPIRAVSGEALYVPLFLLKIKPDLAFRCPSGHNHSWARSNISVNEAAQRFADIYLSKAGKGTGAFDQEYLSWLDLIIERCPSGRLPITGEPREAKRGNLSHVTLFPSHTVRDGIWVQLEEITFPGPPGLANAIDPYKEFRAVIDDRERRERELRAKESFKAGLNKILDLIRK